MEDLSIGMTEVRAVPKRNSEQDSDSHRFHDPKGERNDKGENFGSIPLFSRLDFPRYDGQSDPLGQKNLCEFYFIHHKTANLENVGIASFHLKGDELLWFLKVKHDEHNIRWDNFKEWSNLRYGPTLRCTKLGEVAKLLQLGSVKITSGNLNSYWLELAPYLKIKRLNSLFVG